MTPFTTLSFTPEASRSVVKDRLSTKVVKSGCTLDRGPFEGGDKTLEFVEVSRVEEPEINILS